MGLPAKLPIIMDGITCWACCTCKEALPPADFYSCKRSPNGLKAQCKRCHNSTSIRTRDIENTRRIRRESGRRVRVLNLDAVRGRERLRKRPVDERVMARRKLNTAVQCGKLIRPKVCSICFGGGKITAHHDDYSRPLDVRWLCWGCHGKEHRKASVGAD